MAEAKDSLLRELRSLKKDVIKSQEDCDGLAERVEAMESKLKAPKGAEGASDAEGSEDDDPTGLGNL